MTITAYVEPLLPRSSLGSRLGRTGTTMTRPRVFISYSRADGDLALALNRVLRKNGAETFFDEGRVGAGEDLPARLRDGVHHCQSLLLLWSRSASRSPWVHKEWDLAYELRKKIVPYRLDGTPLPEVLDHIVHVDSDDRRHGHARLLVAVFGRGFQPRDSSSMFPGEWRVTIDPQSLRDQVSGQDFGMFLPRGGGYELDSSRMVDSPGRFHWADQAACSEEFWAEAPTSGA